MAAITLTGTGAAAAVGKGTLRTLLLVGSAASGGAATLRLSSRLAGKGAASAAGTAFLSRTRVDSGGVTVADPDLVAQYYAPGQFPHGTAQPLDAVKSLGFLAELRSAGQAQLVQMNDASTTPDIGGVITFDVKGTRAFAALTRTFTKISVDQREGSGERTTWDMPGHLAIYKKGVIGPPNGLQRNPVIDSFTYNFTHPDYDYTQHSGWVGATEICTVEQAMYAWAATLANPAADPPTYVWNPITGANQETIIWASDGNQVGIGVQSGKCCFVDTATLPYDGAYVYFLGAGDAAKLYIDGALVDSVTGSGDGLVGGAGYKNPRAGVLTLAAGTHHIAIEADNYASYRTSAGSAVTQGGGVHASLWRPGYVDADGFGQLPLIYWNTSATTRVMEYVSELPGMTVGQTLRLITEEQQDAGRLTDVVLNFSDTTDSAGATWDETNITVTVGRDDCLAVIGKIQEAYADVYMDPAGWTLHAYGWDTFAPSSGVTLTEGSNILQLTHRKEDIVASEFLIRSEALGWASDGSGDAQAFLELGSEVAGTDVFRIADALLTIYADVREEISANFEPAGNSETPWVASNFVPGSMMTAPDSTGSPVSERVMALGLSYGDDELLRVQVTIKDRIQDLNERMVQELKH